MKPFEVLGSLYVPPNGHEPYIKFDRVFGTEYENPLRDVLGESIQKFGFNGEWTYRFPNSNQSMLNYFHHDGRGKEAIIFWASSYPTEVRLPDGSIVNGNPYDVVLVDNFVTRHRTPQALVNMHSQRTNRHFIRCILGGDRKPYDEEIDEWKRLLKANNDKSVNRKIV